MRRSNWHSGPVAPNVTTLAWPSGCRTSATIWWLREPPLCKRKAGFRPPFKQWLQTFAKSYPDEFYLPAIALLTAVIAATVIHLSAFDFWSFETYVFLLLVVMLPCSEARGSNRELPSPVVTDAAEIPKLDFTDGIPADCVTLVAVPTLLLNEQQVPRWSRTWKCVFSATRIPTCTSPCSPICPIRRRRRRRESSCRSCALTSSKVSTRNMPANGMGRSFCCIAERVYNPRERVWMGWERKRGKLIDLNNFLRGEYDAFPIKAGDSRVLPRRPLRDHARLRYAASARHRASKWSAAMAHPLNQAIIDPRFEHRGRRLRHSAAARRHQRPQSAARSRLAKIFSGQTGFDIYTRAVSDVYQDLYGEGSFTGKGIYEVDALHAVLDRPLPAQRAAQPRPDRRRIRPRRTGQRHRAHRRLPFALQRLQPPQTSLGARRLADRGMAVLQVPDSRAGGCPIPSPWFRAGRFSTICAAAWSNRRRFSYSYWAGSVLPGSALYWSLATLCLLFLPNLVRLLFHLARAAVGRDPSLVGNLPDSLFAANLGVLLSLIFLAHQMLVSLDAMVRALVRRAITGERMLEWVTAAQEEQDSERRTALDVYLDWTSVLAAALGALVWWCVAALRCSPRYPFCYFGRRANPFPLGSIAHLMLTTRNRKPTKSFFAGSRSYVALLRRV